MKKLSIMLALAAVAGSASAAVVTFDGNGLGGIQDYTVATNWDPSGIPTLADDATVTGRFQLNDGSTRELNSLTVNGFGSFMSSAGTKLNIATDFTVNSGLAINNATGIEWGGLATIGDGTGTDSLSLIYGTHRDPSMAVGNDLDVAANGLINLRWFNPENPFSGVPEIDLSGNLDFAAGSSLRIDLEGGMTDRALGTGNYFLIGSDSFTGVLPTLDRLDWAASSAATSWLEVRPSGLYLHVGAVPEPSSLALLVIGGGLLYGRRKAMLA